MTLFSKFKPLRGSNERLDPKGHEKLSSEPMALPIGFKRPETLAEQVARLVRSERFNQALHDNDLETFDEADDFDVDDDFDPSTPYEMVFDPILKRDVSPDEFFKNKEAYFQKYRQQMENEEVDEKTISRFSKRPKAGEEKRVSPKGKKPPSEENED